MGGGAPRTAEHDRCLQDDREKHVGQAYCSHMTATTSQNTLSSWVFALEDVEQTLAAPSLRPRRKAPRREDACIAEPADQSRRAAAAPAAK
jgi:hypothetical protein